MKVLITGITGFAGSHLVDYALDLKGVEIHGIQRWRSRTENIDHVIDKITTYECDMRDAHSVTNVIKDVRPDRIFISPLRVLFRHRGRRLRRRSARTCWGK